MFRFYPSSSTLIFQYILPMLSFSEYSRCRKNFLLKDTLLYGKHIYLLRAKLHELEFSLDSTLHLLRSVQG